jgi:hypothetical protein
MAIRQMTIHALLNGQDINNVYYFDQTVPLFGSCEDLVGAWETEVLATLEATLSNQLYMNGVRCFNLEDPEDFFEATMDSPGSISADPLPPFVTATYIYNRASRAVHNGYKRFAGIPETATPDGVTISSGYRTLANALAAALGGEIIGTATNYVPIIFHKTSGAGEPLAGTAFTVANVSFDKIGSQISRKVGHGG